MNYRARVYRSDDKTEGLTFWATLGLAMVISALGAFFAGMALLAAYTF